VTAPEPTLLSPVRTAAERELAAIWSELLASEPAGSDEDFFAAGGDSIQAAALLARVCSGLGVELSLAEFVREPTIAALADAIEAARARGATPAAWPAARDGEPARCSYAQERFWFIDQASASNVVSNVSWALRLEGSLDVPTLERALGELALRHDTLRTRFELRDGAPLQIVSSESSLALEVLEARDEAQASALAAAAAQVPFDLARGPLLRVQLLALGPDSHVLHFVAHHIVCDDWSKGVILSELAALYVALRAGEQPSLQPAVQYPDYSRWQRRRLSEQLLGEELEHWRSTLAGASPIELPVDRTRPPAPSTRGARLRTTVPAEVAEALRALGREAGASFFMTMLAALQAFLHRYSRQEDLVVGTAVDNRGRVELERAVGLFTNVLALRGDLSGRPSFRELVSRARATTLDAIAHQELPFDRLAAASPERDASRHPVFQVFYEFVVPAPLQLPILGVRSEPFEVPKHTSEFDLGLYLDEQRGGLDAVWEYSLDLFEPATIERMAGHFIRLLERIVADPDRPIDELALLDDAQRRQALTGAHATGASLPEACIHELFERRVRRAPGAPALVAGEQRLSYDQLNRRANSIAHLLLELGVVPGDAVGVCLERSADLVAAMLGILKAGGAYVPLHPDHPAERLAEQLQSSGARLLIAPAPLDRFAGTLLSLEDRGERLATLPDTDPDPVVGPDDTAYVLFTSGSTGAPKGVAVTHRNLVNYTAHMIETLGRDGTTSGLSFGSVSAVSTDLGNTAIFPALAGGGCLHLIPTEVATDGAAFAAYMAGAPLDVLKIAPSHLSSLLDAAAGAPILPRRQLVIGGEALSWELARRVLAAGGPRVLNHYGPTEATVGCCTYELDLDRPRPPARTVPIGRPISNTTAHVLDRLMEPVPVGVAGELYVGGAGVARGYVGQPEQTAAAFVADPFSEDREARLYRTGDLARRLPDGSIEFLGRVDQQVKIRGYRVEPAEVQAVLMRQQGVRQAAVLAAGEGESTRLVAYVVAGEGEVLPGSLQEALARTLPAYMIPSQTAVLDALPLTPNGKLDRAALPSLDAPPAGAARSEPLTGLQAQLAAVWGELLECELGPDDDFFQAGGHSLLAIRLIARIRAELGVKLTLKALIEAPTIGELAARIEDIRAAAQPDADVPASAPPTPADVPASAASPAPAKAAPTVPQVPREGPLRCSFAQEQLWLVDQLTPGSSAYNFSWPMRLRGRLDTDALGRAVAEVVRRHEALRTRFAATDGQPMQIVEKTGAAALELVDLSGEPDPPAGARRLIEQQTARPFDLARGPLLRVVLMQLGEQDHVLLIVVHHIVFDGVSKVVLYDELGKCYEAFAAGREPSLAQLSIQYADYAEWQRSQLDPERLRRELAHWRAQLDGAPTALELPGDRLRPAVSSLRGARHRQPLSGDLRGSLDALARSEGATFFMAVLAAFEALLYRYTGQEDLLVGTPVDTRSERDLAPVIGPFINTVVLRGDLSGSPSFRELLGRVQERTVDALEHKELPFERLVATLAPERDLSRHPLYQVLLALNPAETGLSLPGVEVGELDPAWSGARVDLFLILDDLPQGLEAIWEYSTDLFEPGTIERMAGHFTRLLEQVVADPDRPIDDLALLGERERCLLREEWNQTEAEIPSQRLEQLVAERARATPERVAVRFGERELGYRDLDLRANRLANRLRALGAAPGELVGVCMNRSEELLVALLATMKTGAAYVPIDPGFPPARQRFMLADAQVRVLVSEESLLASLPASDAAVLCVDRDSAEIALQSSAPPAHDAGADGLAYVIYTSGSTGKPKGVEIQHRALVNLLCAMRERPGLVASDVLVAVTTLSFDIAGLELYLPLIAGAQVVVASAQTAADPRALARLLESCGATAMQATPSTWRMLIDAGWPGRAGLKALCGGEALPPALADELVGRVSELWNMYGPTETTIWSTCAHVRAPGEPPTIGRPIANTTLHVLDRRGRPAPIGVPGELLIGGTGLARGYRNRPELNAERFVAGELGGERLYRTGDLARYRPDGTVQFLGRLDHQVKLRGFRIELGEIEANLAGHPAVAAAAATIHDGPRGEPSLVAYVVPDGEAADPEQLRRFLAESVPAYMVPAAIVTLEALPLTPNGKVDRKALPAPELAALAEDRYREPRNATEAAVASLFCEVLGVDRAGAHDDFFALGGQSLLAARLVSRLDARFGVELPFRVLFEAPTVAGLAAGIEALLSTAGQAPQATESEPLVAEPPAGREPSPLLTTASVRPASFAQERFWLIDQLGAGAAYNISWPLRLRGALDAVALERALNEIVRRHEILRSRFADEDGRPVQVVEPSRAVELEFVDLSGESEREREAQRLVDERTQAPFELAKGPLLRACLLRLGPDEHILQIVVHHAVADGGSKVVFFEELGALYGAYRDNRPAGLSEPPLQYADFARWQRSALDGEQLERELAHWSRELDGIPGSLELPSDRPRPEVATLRGGWLRTKVDDDTLDRLGRLASAQGATLFMAMLAAFEVLLHRYSGQEQVVVGTPVDTRGRAELEQLIGPFVNTLVLRGDLSGAPSFRELLGRVKQRTLDALEHQQLPFERLVEALAPERELGRHPLFQALIALNPPEPAIRLGELEVQELDTKKTASRVDLTLLLQQREQGLELIWEYSSDLFERETVQRMAERFLCLLDSILRDPELPIDELALARDGEREQAGAEQGERMFPVFCLHERFAEQARLTPDAVAVRYEQESLSYRDLNARANRLAHRLRSLGVRADTLVALGFERSLDLVVAVLAVLKAGGAYVPLDPAYPAERLAFVLRDCDAAVLVTHERLLDRFAEHEPPAVVCLDRERSLLERESADDPPAAAGPESLAYAIYTSGSTGQPKGVLVEHRNVARLFTATDDWFAPGSRDTWLLLHSYAFDFSVWEIWGALLHGGTLVVVPPWTARSPDALARLLVNERATVLNTTPSLFMAAMDELLAVADELSLRLVIFGGEALHTRLLAPWFERMPDRRPRLVNMYGITETTVHVTYRPLTAQDAQRDGSPIGSPIPDLDLYVLDAKRKPVPQGVAGELFVGGAGVARGYLNRPELTEQRFVASPFGPGRLYRTGDRVRASADGELLFEGRLDDQVKIRGFRIELGEVQAALAADAAVAECAVVADADGPGDARLAAYVVPARGDTDPASLRAALRERLREKLPEYMVPSSFTPLEALPLTSNGKLDRKALPAPVEDRGAHEPAAPRTELERELAELWRELLAAQAVGIDDDFFELGGHSLLAAQLAARVRSRLGAGLSVRDVFEQPTLAGQARRIESARDSAASPAQAAPAPALARRPAGEAWPLSSSQQQLWLIDQWDPGAPTYNVALAFRVRGALDLDALRRAAAGVLARHEALRTVVRVQDDQPLPVLLQSPRLELESIDLRGRSQAATLETLSDLARRPFDLARDPLLRCSAIRTGEQERIVLIETHHIAFDGFSERVLLDELAALYQGQALAEPPLQFGDFARWQHDWLGLEQGRRELDWWRRQLAGARTSIELPVDRSRPDSRRFAGASHDLTLPADLAADARRLCREEGATPYMLMLAALAALLYRVTGQDDVLVGSPVANRTSPELEALIGFFSNTLVFRVRTGGNPTFRELLCRVRETALDVYAHQGVPFERIVDAVNPERAPGVNPLFQVNLRVSTAARPALELPGLEIAPLKVDSGLSRFDLALDVEVLEDGIGGYFRYNRDIFEPATVARLAGELEALLGAALADPGRALLSFELQGQWSGRRPVVGGLRGFRAQARGGRA
jgi:amino acid adenylation domain-containing protein